MAVVASLGSAAMAADQYYMYVGSLTSARGSTSKGIYGYRFDPAKPSITPMGLLAESSNPFPIRPAPDGKHLYATDWLTTETSQAGVGDSASAFAVDPRTGGLRFLNKVYAKGLPEAERFTRGGLNQIVLDPSGRIAVVTVGVGTVVALPIHADGSLGEAFYIDRHQGRALAPRGGNYDPMVHGAAFSPDGKFLYIADRNLDRLYAYRVDAAKRSIAPLETPFVQLPANTGPRRLVVSPNGKYLYLNLEQSSELRAFRLDQGAPREIQAISSLPAGWTKQNAPAEVQIDKTGRFVYVSNRGQMDGSIAAFKVNQADGTVSNIGFTMTEGASATISIDPTNSFLFSSDSGSNLVRGFRIDPKTGALSETGLVTTVSSPGEVKFIKAP